MMTIARASTDPVLSLTLRPQNVIFDEEKYLLQQPRAQICPPRNTAMMMTENITISLVLARVSGRVVMVVVVVRELFSLVTSAICVRIRGQRLRRLFTT